MINKIGNILKKVILAFGIIYGINILLNGVNIHIPINISTITITTLLGIPGLLSIVVLFFLIN